MFIFIFLIKLQNQNHLNIRLNNAVDNKICVTGSVDGVIIAATIVQITITYFQADNIFSPVTIPNNPKLLVRQVLEMQFLLQITEQQQNQNIDQMTKKVQQLQHHKQ